MIGFRTERGACIGWLMVGNENKLASVPEYSCGVLHGVTGQCYCNESTTMGSY